MSAKDAAARDGSAARVLLDRWRGWVDTVLELDDRIRHGDIPPDVDDVHDLRVALRHLRSDARTFRKILDRRWARQSRELMREPAHALGPVRDAQVMRAWLARETVTGFDPVEVAEVDAAVRARLDLAVDDLMKAMRAPAWEAMLQRLRTSTDGLPVRGRAGEPAVRVLPALAVKPWRRLRDGRGATPAVADLADDAPDEVLHRIRVQTKRARYAAEAAASVKGRRTREWAERLAAVQSVLGEHQDAVVAGRLWTQLADEPGAPVFTCGRLTERAHTVARRCRDDVPAVWRSCRPPAWAA